MRPHSGLALLIAMASLRVQSWSNPPLSSVRPVSVRWAPSDNQGTRSMCVNNTHVLFLLERRCLRIDPILEIVADARFIQTPSPLVAGITSSGFMVAPQQRDERAERVLMRYPEEGDKRWHRSQFSEQRAHRSLS